MIELQRTYHPNGAIRTEVTLADGVPSGITRHWHQNGVLALEMPVRFGLPEGVVKQWAENGQLLGTFEIVNGTGTQMAWHPNGQVSAEISWVGGKWTGRQRTWLSDGTLVGETFWIENNKVSRNRYFLRSEKDGSIPRYVKDGPNRGKRTRIDSPSVVDNATEGLQDELALSLISGSDCKEARSWLDEGQGVMRTIGEATVPSTARCLVDMLYKSGAAMVYVAKIDQVDQAAETTNFLVVELPDDNRRRVRTLRCCDRVAALSGYAPEPEHRGRFRVLNFA